VIARFIDVARNGRPVPITGDGTQTRDFVFVADVARANVVAVATRLIGHHVVDVAVGHETSLLELRAAGDQEHFAFGLAPLKVAVRVGGVGEWEGGVDPHRQLAGANPREQVAGPLQQFRTLSRIVHQAGTGHEQ
jgi:UDP-glucose 4-epimerase